MNNSATLLALGFVRRPEWDWANTEHYCLQHGGAIFRAYVVEGNPPGVYVRLGLVGNEKGAAHWRDCISEGSVARKLAEAERTGAWPTELGRVVSLPAPSKDMLFEDNDGKQHRVVYICYIDGKPRDAISEQIDMPGCGSTWDFEEDTKMEEPGYYMYYESGGFGLHHQGIQVFCSYWAADGFVLHDTGKATRLAEPLILTQSMSRNPFEGNREVLGLEYCRVCDAFYDEDWCPDHHREKKDGGVGYRKGFRKKDQPAPTPTIQEGASHE